MDQFNNKERQIIRLAFSSKNPDLRRRAVEQIITARYTPEFLEWAKSQGKVFNHTTPTGQVNQVSWASLFSKEQTEVHKRYDAGEYKDKGGPSPGGDGGDGGPHANRKALRGVPKKAMKDKAELDQDTLGRMLPMEKISQLEGDKGDRIKRGLMGASYHDLEAIHTSASYMAENPDDEYTKNHWLTKDAKLDHGEMKTFHKALGKKLQDAMGRKYGATVLEIANSNSLEGIDADAVWQFRRDKPARGRKLTPEQLKQKFLQGSWADAETRERVQKMSPDEFEAMRNAIFDEEDDELSFGEVAASSRQASEMNLFERPPGSDKKEANLSAIGRKLVRMAFNSKDPEVRRKLVRRAKAEINT